MEGRPHPWAAGVGARARRVFEPWQVFGLYLSSVGERKSLWLCGGGAGGIPGAHRTCRRLEEDVRGGKHRVVFGSLHPILEGQGVLVEFLASSLRILCGLCLAV